MQGIRKFNEWLRGHNFDVIWCVAHSSYVNGQILLLPENMLAETNRLYRLITDELLIKLATTEEVDDVEEESALPPHIFCSYQPGDELASIAIININDKAMRDAILRLAS